MADAKPWHEFDLVIVGASFAGLVCARTAALRGLKVAVLERKSDAGARVHTTGILVKEAADEIDLPAHLTRKIRRVRLYAPSLASVDLAAPGYYFLASDTAALLRWLAREAERAGARILYGVRFSGAERAHGRIRIEGGGLTTRYLIGADGAKSQVARAFGLGQNKRFLVGLAAEYQGLDTYDRSSLHCFIDGRLAPGYLGWAVPGAGITQVGLATSAGRMPDLAAFEARIASLLGLEAGQIVGRRSGVIPAGGLVRPFAAPGVLLVGDSAGLVSPLTGGGIRLAFHFGRRAAQVVADFLCDRGPDPAAVFAREYPSLALKGVLRRLMDIGLPNWLWDASLKTAPMRRLAQEIYFHRRRAPGAPEEETREDIGLPASPESRPRMLSLT